MTVDCTALFLRYRDVMRTIWNLGFLPYPSLVTWESERAFDEAGARLYEGMILRPLGLEGRVTVTFSPGTVAPFLVRANHFPTTLLMDSGLPGMPGHRWGETTVEITDDGYELGFVSFFDWYSLGVQDYSLVKVIIRRFDNLPSMVGYHALIELSHCSISMEEDESPDGPS